MFCCFVDAYETAKMLCEQYYLVAPDLEVEEFNGNCEINLSDVCKKKTLLISVIYSSVN